MNEQVCLCVIGCVPEQDMHSGNCICRIDHPIVNKAERDRIRRLPGLMDMRGKDLPEYCTRYEGGMCGCSRCAAAYDRGENV